MSVWLTHRFRIHQVRSIHLDLHANQVTSFICQQRTSDICTWTKFLGPDSMGGIVRRGRQARDSREVDQEKRACPLYDLSFPRERLIVGAITQFKS